MHQSFIHHEIFDRIVHIRGRSRDIQKPSDYQPTPEEIEQGASDFTNHHLMFKGKKIIRLDHYQIHGYYGIHWPTNLGIEEGTDSVRRFYTQTTHFDLLPADKKREPISRDSGIEACINIHGVPGVCEGFDEYLPVELLLNKVAFEALIHQNILYDKYLQLLVETPHIRAFYVNNEFNQEGNTSMTLISHRNLIEFLPEYIISTHAQSLPPYLKAAVKQFLTEVMHPYPPLVRIK